MYPLQRFDERTLPRDYDGIVVTCDVDKTYLDTDFESALGLLTFPLEWAEDKRAVAGMAPVLRGLRFGPGPENAQVPFYFMSASPPQMKNILKRKTLIDAIQYDGVTFKDWRAVILKRKKPAWLTRQLAYKVCALLHQRTILPPGSREILIGDDAESDAAAYSLYAESAAGKIDAAGLAAKLESAGCGRTEREEALEAFARITPARNAVRRIYIYLAKGSDPKKFDRFGKILVACKSPFQMAAHLAIDGLIAPHIAKESAAEMIADGRADLPSLAEELEEGLDRGIFKKTRLKNFRGALPSK